MKLLAIANLEEEFIYLEKLPEVVDNLNIEAVLFAGNILKAEERKKEWSLAQKENRNPNLQRAEILAERENDARTFTNFFQLLARLKKPSYIVPGPNDAPER
ncbi:MAG: metallophosphoesterase, partial [Calditrichaeota bacterium]